VIRFAIGRRHVTMTDRDEQPVIGSLQSAHNADSVRLPAISSGRVAACITSGSARFLACQVIGFLGMGGVLAVGSCLSPSDWHGDWN
jgi:hypothetical protein